MCCDEHASGYLERMLGCHLLAVAEELELLLTGLDGRTTEL